MRDPVLSYLQGLAAEGDVGWFVHADRSVLEALPELCASSRVLLSALFDSAQVNDLSNLQRRMERSVVRLPLKEAHLLVTDLNRAFARMAREPKPAVNVASLPSPVTLETNADLEVWAAAHGVSKELDDSLTALSQLQVVIYGLDRVARTYTIRDAHLGAIDPEDRKRLLVADAYEYGQRVAGGRLLTLLRESTTRYLLTAERARLVWEAQRAAAKQLVANPAERGGNRAKFVAWLESFLEAASGEPSPWRTALGMQGSIQHETWKLDAHFRGFEGDELIHRFAEVELVDWELGRLGFRCSCSPTPGAALCQHTYPLLDRAVAMAMMAESPIGRALEVPGWTRLMAAIDDVAAVRSREKLHASGQRLAWRLETEPRGRYSELELVPLLQKRKGETEKFSAGRKVTPYELVAQGFDEFEPRDRKVLELLADEPSQHAVFAALKELAGHPRLYLDKRIDPLVVSEQSVRLVVERAPEQSSGYVIDVSVGEKSVSPARLLGAAQGTFFAILTDEAEPSCMLVELDRTSHALLKALAMSGRYLPEHALDELVRRIPGVQEHVDIALPDSALGRRRRAEHGLHVLLEEKTACVVDIDVRVRPIPGGPLLVPGRGVSRLVAGDSAGRSHVLRDLARERNQADELLSDPALQGAATLSPYTRRVSGLEQLLSFLGMLREHPEITVHWKGEPFQLVTSIAPADVRVRVRGKGSRLLLDGDVELDSERVSLALLLDAARRGNNWVELGPRRFALLEARLLESLGVTADLITSKKKSDAELSTVLAPALEAAISELSLKDDGALARALERARKAVDFKPRLPKTLSKTLSLRPYQLDGFRWLSRLATWGAGAVLADDMGLGKTVQCLAVLVERASLGPQLVVAPTSVCENWAAETRRFAPSLEPILYRGGARSQRLSKLAPHQLVIVSYDILARDIELLEQHAFATLVLDEAQAVKNARTIRARAAGRVRAEWRVALTGTPLENHIGELFSIVDLVEPGLLGRWDDFAERFARPIEVDGDQRRLAALRKILGPFILRRTKSEVLTDLPPRIELTRTVSLAAGERELYDQARLAALARLAGGGHEARIELFAALTRLRRLVCHPRLYDQTSTQSSSKLTTLLEIADELRAEERRALVFSQFTSFLDLVEPELRAAGFSTLRLDGTTPAPERARIVEGFQKGEADLFLISLKAGGTGLNLTGADTVILLDPWWNPAAEDQASSRAHRIGQTAERVTVIRLVAQGTIEERVLEMHAEKRDLAARVLSEGDAGARLSNAELLSLLESSFRDDTEGESAPSRSRRSKRAATETSNPS